jgi:hypothetical protein
VAWPLAAWLVIASQLLDHLLLLYILAERRERTGPTLKAKMVSDGEGGWVF